MLQPSGSRLAMECSAVHGKGCSEALSEATKIYEHEYNYENIEILAVTRSISRMLTFNV